MDWRSTQSAGPFQSVETLRSKTHDTVLLPRLTLEYRPDAQQFAWTTLARGYKASGFNQYATDSASAAQAYQPEYGNYAELGYRLQGLDDTWSCLLYTSRGPARCRARRALHGPGRSGWRCRSARGRGSPRSARSGRDGDGASPHLSLIHI